MALRVPSRYVTELEPAVVIAAGALLVVFSEPVTSAFGAGLLLLGLSWWIDEWGPVAGPPPQTVSWQSVPVCPQDGRVYTGTQ